MAGGSALGLLLLLLMLASATVSWETILSTADSESVKLGETLELTTGISWGEKPAEKKTGDFSVMVKIEAQGQQGFAATEAFESRRRVVGDAGQ